MRYAEQISEMINAFSPEPLKQGQMAEFYCADTMEYRTSDKFDSPIEDIFDFCQESEESDYNFLLNIYRGNKERIQDKEMLLRMLQASVVLEYNGKRWHSVHPLVARFFEEQGLIDNAES